MLRATQGFSLVEAFVAIALVSTAVVGLMQLLIVATTANQSARATTVATLTAIEKMEQLHGLLWAFDATGQRIADTTSDLTTVPDGLAGTGLSPSPASALQQNVQGFCDFVDSSGVALGAGTSPPPGTAYVRRWSIEPMAIRSGRHAVCFRWQSVMAGRDSRRPRSSAACSRHQAGTASRRGRLSDAPRSGSRSSRFWSPSFC